MFSVTLVTLFFRIRVFKIMLRLDLKDKFRLDPALKSFNDLLRSYFLDLMPLDPINRYGFAVAKNR